MKTNETASVKLTDSYLKKLKPTFVHRDISDTGTSLTARLKANGEIAFLWRGRIEGRATKKIIGSFPAMSVNDARAACLNMKSEAKTIKLAPRYETKPRFMTVEKAFERYMREHADNLASGPNIRATIELRIMQKFGARELKSLKRAELNEHFNAMKAEYRGAGINRVLAHLKAFLNWCVREDLLEANPALQIQRKAKENARKRLLKDRELGYLQLALGQMGPYHPALSLLLHTCARLSDIFNLQWREVVDCELHIEMTKAGVPHIIHMTEQARAFIPVRPRDAKSTDFVFPDISRTRGSSYLTKMRKLTTEWAIRDKSEIDHFTLHDFRTACATWISSQNGRGNHKFSDRALDLLLAHIPHGVTKRHYNHSECLDEREEMLTLWSNHLDECLAKVQNDIAKREE